MHSSFSCLYFRLTVIGAGCFGQDNIIFSNIWFQFMIKDMNLYGV